MTFTRYGSPDWSGFFDPDFLRLVRGQDFLVRIFTGPAPNPEFLGPYNPNRSGFFVICFFKNEKFGQVKILTRNSGPMTGSFLVSCSSAINPLRPYQRFSDRFQTNPDISLTKSCCDRKSVSNILVGYFITFQNQESTEIKNIKKSFR